MHNSVALEGLQMLWNAFKCFEGPLKNAFKSFYEGPKAFKNTAIKLQAVFWNCDKIVKTAVFCTLYFKSLSVIPKYRNTAGTFGIF